MANKTLKDVTKVLSGDFAAKTTLSLPPETRRMLQDFVDERDGHISVDNSALANQELKTLWEKYVGGTPQKLGMFVSVLRLLLPTIVTDGDRLHWAKTAAIPVVGGLGYPPEAVEDARQYLVATMIDDDNAENASSKSATLDPILEDLINTYVARSTIRGPEEALTPREDSQIIQQVESVLIAFGRQRPKSLFNLIDELIVVADTRLQALSLLISFLRLQTPHLYLVSDTPLIEHLLKCLTNDTSATILSVALTSFIMLLPHIPGSLGPLLPSMFLVYSRFLCFERFSELSTEEQKSLVTDERYSQEGTGNEEGEVEEVGFDSQWDKARSQDGATETFSPALMTYFTYLYGLYPLNFMSFIRKPRRYLKNANFPSADSFDLDQAIIRTRSEQLRQAHLVHPNFYHLTIEEELADPKWSNMDTADVVGECQALCVNSRALPRSPGPPPTGRLPDIPALPAVGYSPKVGARSQISPVPSRTSLRSGNSWRDTQSTAVSVEALEDNPALTFRSEVAQDGTQLVHSKDKAAQNSETNVTSLQRELTVLRNEVNFERWHKAQYSQHISQIMRRNVKGATADAEWLNVINANRSLKKQLEQIQKAREATIKDSTLTRKQANSLEGNMTERFNKLKMEQETWQADADELRRLRTEMRQYRDLLVATEARELNKSHQLELAQRDLTNLKDVKDHLAQTRRQVREFEYREFDYETASRERDILRDEKEMLLTKMERNNEHRERMRKSYATRIADLETQIEDQPPSTRFPISSTSSETQATVQRAVADSEAKLASLKKAHTRLLENYTDLELQLESLKASQQSIRGSEDQGYDVIDEYSADMPRPFADIPKRRISDPPRMMSGALPPTPSPSVTTVGTSAPGALRRANSLLSKSSGNRKTYAGPSRATTRDETRSEGSESGMSNKQKIQPDSSVRVYGRGGAQNIKLKQKDDGKANPEPKKSSGFRGLRKLV